MEIWNDENCRLLRCCIYHSDSFCHYMIFRKCVCCTWWKEHYIYIYEDYPMHPSFFCDMSCLTFKCPASFFLRRKAPKLRIAPHVTGQQFESNFSDRRWQNMWPFFFECPKTWTWTEHWFSVFEGALQAFIRFLTTCELGFCSILKNR